MANPQFIALLQEGSWPRLLEVVVHAFSTTHTEALRAQPGNLFFARASTRLPTLTLPTPLPPSRALASHECSFTDA
ncbi:hypothetical protein K437DRAFT_255861 [Tilletiaria anomala UBC 951]|uniref:Uncharacterized protein n=1 Tax=Tilletiaria anomala (strain ATCC 24038 / CBS 436.72 / UBC 951) TaxID=1037660 RepID=A0A066W030_TILAU|nr:uncharacterized protein K437DRAFT_255861 [Tilletiaria anomala UBC 951]KDN47322.1 hypothetical protein K437DRAFT_255861 [Tilletiaria anomala UBC 951]